MKILKLDVVAIMEAAVLGMGIGGLNFAGLWRTVTRVLHSQRPAMLSFGSLFARLIAVTTGFYLIMDGQVDRLFASLIGFVIVRLIAIELALQGRKVTNNLQRNGE